MSRTISTSRYTRRSVLRAGAAMGGLWLAACVGAAPQGGPSASSGPKRGGQAVIYVGHPDTLNPIISPVSTTIYNTPFFFNGLTRPGDDYAPQPDLAESWTASPDNKSFTFKLRKDVKFHDGRPFTADDVKFSWELYAHPENVAARQIGNFFSRIAGAPDWTAGKAREITGIKVIDAHTIEVTLTQVYAPFLTIAAGQMIVPKHVWQSVAVKDFAAHPAARKPIGTGPFVSDSWTTNESIVMHAYEDYHFGRPWLDRIVSQAVADQATGFGLLKAGELDVMGLYSSIPIDNYEEARADSQLEARPLPGLANMYAEFNFRDPLFQDVRVRKALSYAADRKAIRDGLWRGQATHINGPIHPAFWAANPNTTTFDGDVAKANDLFAQAGWKRGADGILEKDGQKLRFKIQSISRDYDVALQDQWKKVGVDAQVERMDFGSFWAPLYLQGKTQLAALNLPFGLYLDPDYPLTGYFHSALNRNKYKNERVDSLIGQATATLDRDERKRIYADFQETLAQDVPHLWIGVPNEIWGIRRTLVIPKKPVGYLTIRAARDWYREDAK
ncbi:MAG: ABC transporter substrate-binding protein [Candidatus Limnocylindria bacterium]